MTVNANIYKYREGKFRAAASYGPEVISADPEHDLCHAFVKAGFPDGPIQFWRDGKPSLFHPSIHRMARVRIKLGESFPMQRVKREEISHGKRLKIGAASIAGGDLELP